MPCKTLLFSILFSAETSDQFRTTVFTSDTVSSCKAVATKRSPYRNQSDSDTRRIQRCQWSVCSFSFTRLAEHLTLDISIVLGHGNGQPTQPITVNLRITAAVEQMTSNRNPQEIPTEGGDTHAGATDSRELNRSTEPKPIQTWISAHTSQNQGETSLVEEAQIGLNLAEEAKESIDLSDTWEGVVGKIKWVMDTLSPVAGVRATFVSIPSSTEPAPVFSFIRLCRWCIVWSQ